MRVSPSIGNASRSPWLPRERGTGKDRGIAETRSRRSPLVSVHFTREVRFSRLNASSRQSVDIVRGSGLVNGRERLHRPSSARRVGQNRSEGFHGELQKDQTSDALYHPNFIFVGLFACAGISMEFFGTVIVPFVRFLRGCERMSSGATFAPVGSARGRRGARWRVSRARPSSRFCSSARLVCAMAMGEREAELEVSVVSSETRTASQGEGVAERGDETLRAQMRCAPAPSRGGHLEICHSDLRPRDARARNSRASSLVPSDASPPTLGKSVVRYATGSLFASPYPHLPDRRRARTLEMWLALRNQRVKLHLFSGFVAPRSAPKRPARALPAPSLSPIHALFFRREFGQPADRRSPRPRSRVVLQRRGQRCVPGRRRESRKCGHRRP